MSGVKNFKNALSYSDSNVNKLVTPARENVFQIHIVLLSKTNKTVKR